MFSIYNVAQSCTYDYEREILQAQGIENMYITPLINQNEVIGFLGVDNPKNQEEGASILNAIGQIVAGELIKTSLLLNERTLRQSDMVSGAKSRSCLTELFSTTNTEAIFSVGAVMANIMDLASINAKYGTAIGDSALKETASILKEVIGENCIYRYGDSILLALPFDMSSEVFYKKATLAAEKLNQNPSYNTAVGYTWSDSLSGFNELLSNVTLLMQASKNDRESKANEHFRKKKSNVKALLLDAIETEKAVIYLQPKVCIDNGKVCGAEALIRMKNDKGEIIPPLKFIPILEELNLIHYVDFFVLEKVVECLAKWKEDGKILYPISLNFSRATFLEPDAVDRICATCQKYNISTKYIEIEITESLGDIEAGSIILVANRFFEKGIRLALDDFGAKYSNISIFGSIPFATLKMDKSMIDPILANPRMMAVAESIIDLCHKQSIHVVAEGVENQDQLKALNNIQCDVVQGYVINKPLPLTDYESLYCGMGKEKNE